MFLMIEDRNSVKSSMGSFYVSTFKMTSLQNIHKAILNAI